MNATVMKSLNHEGHEEHEGRTQKQTGHARVREVVECHMVLRMAVINDLISKQAKRVFFVLFVSFVVDAFDLFICVYLCSSVDKAFAFQSLDSLTQLPTCRRPEYASDCTVRRWRADGDAAVRQQGIDWVRVESRA